MRYEIFAEAVAFAAFDGIARNYGLRLRVYAGRLGMPVPAFMTGGVAAGDYDSHTDLIFTRLNHTDVFYRNRGDGTFEP